MDQQRINELYEKFQITKNKIPEYTNPHDFASKFKRCSIVQEVNVEYSNTSYNNITNNK